MRDEIDRILAPGGLLERAGAGYEDRPAQRTMASSVLDSIEWGRHLVVEAGTGTGKTLAYLVPAILSGRKVIVSTATRALQEQVFKKDLPLLFELMGRSFRASCLKGRANYVCHSRRARFDAQPLFPFRDDASRYEIVRDWIDNTDTGDLADLCEVPEDWSTWREIVSSTDTCMGQRCVYADSCFLAKARAEAAAADIVVVNHHLFFADLSLKMSPAGVLGGAEVLPRYDAVIFDEAHVLEDVATAFFGASVSNHRIRDLVRDTSRIARVHKTRALTLQEAAVRLDERAERFFMALALQDGRQRLNRAILDRAREQLFGLREALDLMATEAGKEEDDDELFSIERRAREIGLVIDHVVDLDSTGLVHWSEVRGGGVFLHASPVDAASELRDHLLTKVDSCVFTSATLSSGGSLRYFLERIGLTSAGEHLFDSEASILPSPFDFERQAALYVPQGVVSPKHQGFADEVAEEVLQLLDITDGRAFVLCTSYKNLDAIHRRLVDADLPWPLLRQGEAPKGALLDRFKEEPSVLVATHSFWEGVDVPGRALSLVIIDKLPFAPPEDPVLAARRDVLRAAGKDPFNELYLPQAALSLKQGFGRLIRTNKDRGIVAVCDVRLAEMGYRGHFLKTLPPCPRFRSRDELSAWWRAGDR